MTRVLNRILKIRQVSDVTIETEVDETHENEEEEKDTEKTVSMSDFLRHTTGSKYVRSSMYGTGAITFLHKRSEGTRFEATTCSLELQFPVTKRYTGDCQQFIVNVFEDILNTGMKFGKI